MDFNSLKLSKQILQALTDLGYKKPTPIQEQVIPKILEGQDVLAIAPTGTGKTAAFMLPILQKLNFAKGGSPRALVFVPTRELAVQVYDNTVALSKYTDLRCHKLIGGVGKQSQIKEVAEGVDIIIATPGRFMDIYSQGAIFLKRINTLVLDEADKMLDMGFLPQLNKILEVIPNKRQNLLFSATFHPKVERLTQEFLVFPKKVQIEPEKVVVDLVDQYLYRVPNAKTKLNLLVHLLKNEKGFDRVLVFARTRETAENIHRFLNRKKVGEWRAIHANKGQNTRLNAYKDFSEGKIRGVVATDVAARGIDVTAVTHVINFDAPVMYTDYVHRVGRTGRAENEGVAITFMSKVEQYHIDKIQELIRHKIKVLEIPTQVEIFDSTFEEKQAFAREIDRQKRKEDPSYQGAFHEKKKAKKNKQNRASRKTIQAYKFITEESKKKKKKEGKNNKRKR